MCVLPSPRPSPCQTQIETEFGGQPVVLDACGALYLTGEDILVVSDLHLEKGSYFASRGNPIPRHDTRDTLLRLAAAVECYGPRIVICLGDSFHDVRAGERMERREAALLDAIMGSVAEWIWVRGNHDPEIAARFKGRIADGHRAGAVTLCHRPEDGVPPLIAGHYHPKRRMRLARQHISAPCFMLGLDRLLMPAFGAYAGGLSTTDDAIAALFADGPCQHVLIYGNKLWAFTEN